MSSLSGTAPPAFTAGQRASFEAVIDAELVDSFARLSGDANPLHLDDEYARATSFGGRIAHGMIAGALFSRLVGMHLPGESALYRSQRLRFLAPIRLGTRVRVEGEVAAYDPELSLLTLRTMVRGASGKPLYVEGEAEVVLRSPAATAAAPETWSPAKLDSQPAAAAGHPAKITAAPLPLAAAPVVAACEASLRGRRALIVGGSGGIGAVIARELARRGASISLGYHAHREAAQGVCLQLAALGVPAAPVRLDLRDPELLARAVHEAAGEEGLDVLVHCAHGEIARKGIDRLTSEDLRDAFTRAVEALHALANAALPGMKRKRRGAIVAVASSVTLEPPPPCWTAYTAAKCALVGYVRGLAVELGPHGIRANLVSPALTETERTLAQPARIREELAARSPLGRLARPEEVARAVAFLASDESSYLTGVNLPVAGGMVMA